MYNNARKALVLLVMLLAVSMLTACASGPTPTQAPILLLPPAHLTQQCLAPPPPTSGALTDLLSNHITTAKLLHQCRDRQRGLVEWMEDVNAAQ